MKTNYGVSLKWLAVSSFEMRFGKTTVVSDPYITECVGTDLDWTAVENCDLITLGHAHWDHVTDIPRLVEKFNPRILCGDQTAMPLATWLNCNPSKVYPMYPNLELDFGDVKIRALFGRHITLPGGFRDQCQRLAENPLCVKDPGMAAIQPYGSMEYRNYLYTLPNGTKILLWGNEPTVDQINICKELKPDIAILQRSSVEGNVARAKFAKEIGCKVVIPHHHDFRQVDSPEAIDAFEKAFLDLVPDGIFIRPKHGEWIDL